MQKLEEKKLQEKIGFNPHKAQKEILDKIKRFTVICAGTRFGKSILCAYLCLRQLMKPNQHIWVVAPTYDLAKKTYNYLAMWIGKAFPRALKEGSIRMSDRVGTMRIEFKLLKSWIEFKSADNPTSLLGEELDLVIIDECSRIKNIIWESYLYSRLTSRKGSAVFISTPFGKNWFYRQWIKNKTGEDGSSFHFTSLDNPYFSKSEWDKARKELPEMVFKQEHEAKFLDDAASVFRGIRDIVENTLKDSVAGRFYTMGVDLGRHEDFTVLTIIDRNTHETVYWDRFNKIDYPFQRARIESVAKRYNNARIIIDSTGVGDPVTSDLQRMGLLVDDFKFTNKSKEQLVQKLSLYIERKLIRIPNNNILIDELESFGYRLTESKIIYSAPQGQHDDCVISLGLAVWGLFKDKPQAKNAIQIALEKRSQPKTGSDI